MSKSASRPARARLCCQHQSPASDAQTGQDQRHCRTAQVPVRDRHALRNSVPTYLEWPEHAGLPPGPDKLSPQCSEISLTVTLGLFSQRLNPTHSQRPSAAARKFTLVRSTARCNSNAPFLPVADRQNARPTKPCFPSRRPSHVRTAQQGIRLDSFMARKMLCDLCAHPSPLWGRWPSEARPEGDSPQPRKTFSDKEKQTPSARRHPAGSGGIADASHRRSSYLRTAAEGGLCSPTRGEVLWRFRCAYLKRSLRHGPAPCSGALRSRA